MIAVIDDGAGIAAGDAERIFEPGFSGAGGAGLGLPLARRLARAAGGDVVAVPQRGGARSSSASPPDRDGCADTHIRAGWGQPFRKRSWRSHNPVRLASHLEDACQPQLPPVSHGHRPHRRVPRAARRDPRARRARRRSRCACSCPIPRPPSGTRRIPSATPRPRRPSASSRRRCPTSSDAAGVPHRRVRLDPARPDGRDRGAAARRADRRADHRHHAAPHRGLAARRPAPPRRAPRAAGDRAHRADGAATLTDPHAHRRIGPSLGRRMLNKVPEVTFYFWLIKIMCTTVGETAADYLNDNLGFGLTKTTIVAGALLVVLLVVQFRARRYIPGVYWSVVVVISVFGTLITDNMTDRYNVPLTTSTPIFAVDPGDRLRGLVVRSSARSRSTRSSPPAARRSTGSRSSSRSRSAPPPATWSPRRSASATASRSRSSARVIAADRHRPLRASSSTPCWRSGSRTS